MDRFNPALTFLALAIACPSLVSCTRQKLQENTNYSANNEDTPRDTYMWNLAGPIKEDRFEIISTRETRQTQAESGDQIVIHYTVSIKDGPVLYTSIGRSLFEFELDGNEVSAEFNRGLKEIRVSEKRKIIIPTPAGSSTQKLDSHEYPRETLIYDVEVLGIKKRKY